MACSTSCKLATASIFGLFFALLGTMLVIYWPQIFEHILDKELALSKGSTSFHLWEVTQIPLFFEFYLFTWTNPHEFKIKGKKPILVERGPYVFREYRRKLVQAWFPENSTVTYFQNRTWIFDKELSKGSLDDEITTINVPAITATYSVRHKRESLKFGLNLALDALRTKISVTKKVREFLFDGYEDKLLDIAKYLPVSIPFDKFGWFYTRNGSEKYDGLFNIQTGEKDMSKFGSVSNWDYVNTTSFYDSYCGNVNGSAGEFFPPRQKKDKISIFSSDACRTLTLSYREETNVDGIPGYRFIGDDEMFFNKTTYPDNWCFCPDGECAPNGVLDISTCKWGAPAFISFPHFYHADPSYREAVVGMNPKEPLHQMIIDVEPRTGIPLRVSAGMQINILVQPMKEYSLLENVPKIYFPAVWFRQVAQVDDKMAPQLRMLASLPSIGTIISYVILSVGVTILVVAGVVYATVLRKKDDEALYLRPISASRRLKTNFLNFLRSRILRNPLSSRRKVQQDPSPASSISTIEGCRVVSMIPTPTITTTTPAGINLNVNFSGIPPNINTAAGRRTRRQNQSQNQMRDRERNEHRRSRIGEVNLASNSQDFLI